MNDDFRTEFALKNFVWFLIFVLICGICIAKILYPQIENYKKQAIESRKTKVAFEQIEKDYQSLKNQLQNLSVQNYTILSALYRNGDENTLLGLLQDKFNQVQVKKLNTTQDNDISDVRYQVIGYVQDTKTLEDFIVWANTMPYFARVELPLKMEFDSKTKMIYFIMMISLRHSSYAEHPLILENGLRFDNFKPKQN